MAAKDREHARLALPIHVNRADLKVILVADNGEQKAIAGRALLTDFKPKGIYLYSTERLPPNLEVIFEVQYPEYFRIVGKIIWCQYQPSSSRVLTDQSFHYRVGMGFHFLNDEDQKRYTEYCAKIQDFYVSPRVLFENTPDILMRVEPTVEPVSAQSPKGSAVPPVLQAVPDAPPEDLSMMTLDPAEIAAIAAEAGMPLDGANTAAAKINAQTGADSAMNPDEIEALLAEVAGGNHSDTKKTPDPSSETSDISDLKAA